MNKRTRPAPKTPPDLYAHTVEAIKAIPVDVLRGVANGQIDLNLLAKFQLSRRTDGDEVR